MVERNRRRVPLARRRAGAGGVIAVGVSADNTYVYLR